MEKQEQFKLKEISALYGSHMAMRIATERSILAGGRLFGKSSHHGLKMHMGLYDELGFEDWLNDPLLAPTDDHEKQRMAIESAYGVR